MIAVDTSSIIAYLDGDTGKDTNILDEALQAKQVALPPTVLTELLSDPFVPKSVRDLLKSLPLLEISDGYWERAGISRSMILKQGHKARLADALITQSCLDQKLGLLTRDNDFRAFSKFCGLVLVS